MIQSIKSVLNTIKIDKASIVYSNTELPMLTFNKMCFGFLHNDWIVVIASMAKLAITTASLAFVIYSSRSI